MTSDEIKATQLVVHTVLANWEGAQLADMPGYAFPCCVPVPYEQVNWVIASIDPSLKAWGIVLLDARPMGEGYSDVVYGVIKNTSLRM